MPIIFKNAPACAVLATLLGLGGCAGIPEEKAAQVSSAPCACEAVPVEVASPVECITFERAKSEGPAQATAPAPQAPPGPPPPPVRTPAGTLLVGEVEHVLLGSEKMLQTARIDTGATTTSVGIHTVEKFERDGAKWVKFTVKDRITGEEKTFERPLVRNVRIKNHGAKSDRRMVVRMRITMGELRRNVDVTLTNRDSFDYPVLIGRNFLEGRAVVDVSRQYVTSDKDQS